MTFLDALLKIVMGGYGGVRRANARESKLKCYRDDSERCNIVYTGVEVWEGKNGLCFGDFEGMDKKIS